MNNQKNVCGVCGNENCNHHNYILRRNLKLVYIIVILIGLGLIVNLAVKNYTKYSNPETIIITGQGEINSTPNISTINFTIREESKDNNTKLLQDNVANKANVVIQKLTDLGIESKDIQTSNYSVNPKYNYTNGSSKVVGYEASESIKVKVRDTKNVSKVLDILASQKITEVYGPNYESDDESLEQIKDQARSLAIADAKEKANVLAKELGVRIKRIISYSDDTNNNPSYPVMFRESAKSMTMDAGAQPNLPTGENKTSVNVNITFQIEN